MLPKWVLKSFSSLFIKLMLLMFVSGILIVTVVISISWHMHRDRNRELFRRNMNQYMEYLIADLGTPPRLERAKALSDHLFLAIRYEGVDASWSTGGIFPPLEDVRFRLSRSNPKINVGWHRGDAVFRISNGEQTLLIAPQKEEIPRSGWLWGVLLVASILGIVFLTYLVLRWLLLPIRWLSGGVEALSMGDLDHRVKGDRFDELGRLSRAFNRMAERIRTMMATRQQLLLDVSHELRSPMTRMKVALEMLPRDSMHQNLEEDLQEMESMVTEILETSRLQSRHGRLNLETTDLVQLARNVAANYCEKNPGVVLQDLPSSMFHEIDPEQIRIVLQNLLNNAVRYSTEESPPVEITLNQHDRLFSLYVKDYGIGIAPEEHEMIFEPFYRVDKSRKCNSGNYGLGLNLCKTIMEAHGGNIRVESEPGSGSVFVLEFPLQTDGKITKPAMNDVEKAD